MDEQGSSESGEDAIVGAADEAVGATPAGEVVDHVIATEGASAATSAAGEDDPTEDDPTEDDPTEDEDEDDLRPPVPAGSLVTGMPPAAPRAGWTGNVAAAALLPVAVVAGALAHQDRSYHDPLEQLVVGGVLVGTFGLFLAPLARLAHRWGTEWLALLAAGGPWIFSSIVIDFGRPRLAWSGSLASYHAACLRTPLELGNLGGSSSALMLGALALVLALLLESRRPPEPTRLARAALLLSLVPVSAAALTAAYAADMWGFVLIAVVLAVLAALRTARTVNLAEPRSLSLALASTVAGAASIAAASSGAVTHAMALAMDHLVGTHVPVLLLRATERIASTSLAAVTPILTVIPLVGLAFALVGRPRAPLPRVASALSVAALVLLSWLDVRNVGDLRVHLDGYLYATGARALALPIAQLDLPRVDGDSRIVRDFLVVPHDGLRYYRGRPLAAGRGGLRGLPRGSVPVLFERTVRVVDALEVIGAVGGTRPTPLVGVRSDDGALTSVDVGPFVPEPSVHVDAVVLYLVLQENDTCVLESSAGERFEVPGCWGDLDSLRVRLQDRRAAEPNRHDIVLGAERAITIGQLLPVVELLDATGYDVRPLVDISRL